MRCDGLQPALRRMSARSSRPSLANFRADWLGGLAVHVVGIGIDFEVLGPPEFVEELHTLAERFSRATDQPGRRGR